MIRTAILLATLVTSCTGVHAQSAAQEAETMLRVASAQAAIMQFCQTRYALDGPTSFKLGQASRDAATQLVGEKRAAAAFKRELLRRFNEVKITGEAQWCTYQRATLNSGGVRVFLN